MTDKRCLYFGCYKEKGHYLYNENRNTEWNYTTTIVPHFPWGYIIDAGLLKNGNQPDVINGEVRSTCGGKPDLWIAFCWWDRSVDSRPNSNSGFYVTGFPWEEKQAAFEYACSMWPEVVQRQKVQLHLV